MKLIVAFAAVAALTAGPALAQSSFNKPLGSWTPGSPGSSGASSGHRAPSPSYSTPSYGSEPTQKIYGAPEPPKAPGFKPYEPYEPGSTYASPKPPSYGSKPCETSVYVNACGNRR